MAIEIKTLYECPHCKSSLLSEKRPEVCPSCNYEFSAGTVQRYRYPHTLSEQHEAINNAMQFHTVIADMPIAKANFIVNDALNIIKTLPAKNVRVSDIRSLVTMAIQIGEIAKKYQEYLEVGGTHVPSLFIQDKEEKGGNKTRLGGETP